PGQLVNGKLVPYQGHNFRILYAQGAEAPGGAKQYVRNGRMTDGFALIAWPARYASSGIMSFIVNQDGIVFQKDLGPETARVAASLTQFNSDPSWARVDLTDQQPAAFSWDSLGDGRVCPAGHEPGVQIFAKQDFTTEKRAVRTAAEQARHEPSADFAGHDGTGPAAERMIPSR